MSNQESARNESGYLLHTKLYVPKLRPLLLGSFAVFTAAFTGYYLATTSLAFIVIRGLAGALTAGLGPATMGIIADIAPEDERARFTGGRSSAWRQKKLENAAESPVSSARFVSQHLVSGRPATLSEEFQKQGHQSTGL